jgi:hypothetical protein
VVIVFKDLQRLVSQQQREKTAKELFERLQGNLSGYGTNNSNKEEDIRTDGDCCFNHIIGLPQKDSIDKILYYQKIIFDSLITQNLTLILLLATSSYGYHVYFLYLHLIKTTFIS